MLILAVVATVGLYVFSWFLPPVSSWACIAGFWSLMGYFLGAYRTMEVFIIWLIVFLATFIAIALGQRSERR